jgi:predicted O-methyltransferase YrrM
MRSPATAIREYLGRRDFDQLGLAALEALPGCFLPWSPFAMRPGAILTLLNEVITTDSQVIVECGSGLSTVYLGRLLRQRGYGHVVSLEHDKKWGDLVERWLNADGLADLVDVVHAPLVDGWYDRQVIPSVSDIDLLVVDGPPAYVPETAECRYPALPYFYPSMRDGATVILDDILRAGESAIVERWSRELPVSLECRRNLDALAVGRVSKS